MPLACKVLTTGVTCKQVAAISFRPRAALSLGQAPCYDAARLPARDQRRRRPCAATPSDDAPGVPEFSAAFSAELAARKAAEAAAAEAAAAAAFDGPALLRLLQDKYGRSYDLSIVRRPYMGRTFLALNVMWKYAEQASWSLTKEEYMQRLNYYAALLRAWGQVGTVRSQLAATKERPRVGKAVSLMLSVDDEVVREFLSN